MGTTLATAFALLIPSATAALVQGQTSSPPGSPTSPSSAPELSAHSSVNADATRTVRVGGIEAQANLIYQVAPLYPPLAKTAHVSGTVVQHSVIGRDGTVQDLQYISGPALLMKSAIDAVRQWRYKPTHINGAAVQVDTTVSVVFFGRVAHVSDAVATTSNEGS